MARSEKSAHRWRSGRLGVGAGPRPAGPLLNPATNQPHGTHSLHFRARVAVKDFLSFAPFVDGRGIGWFLHLNEPEASHGCTAGAGSEGGRWVSRRGRRRVQQMPPRDDYRSVFTIFF
jgi:hypothetical protein